MALADNSSIFIGFAAAFLGGIGGAVALTITIAGRAALWGLDLIELIQMLLVSLAGASWSILMRGWDRRNMRALLMLGVLVTAALLPGHLWHGEATLAAPRLSAIVSLAINICISVLLGSFIERERIMLEGEQHLRRLADTDQLTNLYNRRTIIAAFESRILDDVGHAMLLIDVDNFKSVNDAHGHAAGDTVLRHIADNLRHSVRTGDVVGRFGGEEFAVLLSAASLEEALIAAERLREGVERNRVRINQLALTVTVSVGVVWWQGGADFNEVFQAADGALYRAKRNGRNQVQHHLQSGGPEDTTLAAQL